MVCKTDEWQRTAKRVIADLRKHVILARRLSSPDAAATIGRLLSIESIRVSDDLGDAGFALSNDGKQIDISLTALNLIESQGRKTNYDGLDKEDFREFALSLYLFHEMHHVVQGLISFEDVQLLKRTAGIHKLGEMDVIADIVAAQVVAAIYSARKSGDRREFAEGFYAALCFMISFCFPAFGFPIARRHKVQRALGIVLSAVLAERAILRNKLETKFEVPLYPSFSRGFREVAIIGHGGSATAELVLTSRKLQASSIREMLRHIDSGDVAAILEKARALV